MEQLPDHLKQLANFSSEFDELTLFPRIKSDKSTSSRMTLSMLIEKYRMMKGSINKPLTEMTKWRTSRSNNRSGESDTWSSEETNIRLFDHSRKSVDVFIPEQKINTVADTKKRLREFGGVAIVIDEKTKTKTKTGLLRLMYVDDTSNLARGSDRNTFPIKILNEDDMSPKLKNAVKELIANPDSQSVKSTILKEINPVDIPSTKELLRRKLR